MAHSKMTSLLLGILAVTLVFNKGLAMPFDEIGEEDDSNNEVDVDEYSDREAKKIEKDLVDKIKLLEQDENDLPSEYNDELLDENNSDEIEEEEKGDTGNEVDGKDKVYDDVTENEVTNGDVDNDGEKVDEDEVREKKVLIDEDEDNVDKVNDEGKVLIDEDEDNVDKVNDEGNADGKNNEKENDIEEVDDEKNDVITEDDIDYEPVKDENVDEREKEEVVAEANKKGVVTVPTGEKEKKGISAWLDKVKQFFKNRVKLPIFYKKQEFKRF